jgi:hypothetical protein
MEQTLTIVGDSSPWDAKFVMLFGENVLRIEAVATFRFSIRGSEITGELRSLEGRVWSQGRGGELVRDNTAKLLNVSVAGDGTLMLEFTGTLKSSVASVPLNGVRKFSKQ